MKIDTVIPEVSGTAAIVLWNLQRYPIIGWHVQIHQQVGEPVRRLVLPLIAFNFQWQPDVRDLEYITEYCRNGVTYLWEFGAESFDSYEAALAVALRGEQT